MSVSQPIEVSQGLHDGFQESSNPVIPCLLLTWLLGPSVSAEGPLEKPVGMVLSDHIGCVLGKAVISLALCTPVNRRSLSYYLLYTVSLEE